MTVIAFRPYIWPFCGGAGLQTTRGCTADSRQSNPFPALTKIVG